ncbi:hypothetical protein BHU72_06070 [Desulfuribacillus stibiiarsenatis]|uniref:Uncharacterized protein n=1 Tax=Desulfuribacillus stibiiarsenatis TaxID=1390249 RepID=A0A1E5L533_9FIRM|nr:hypothetical protein [Desulfuribacillus stibiiarsenatis]OEH85174.1 hypothetical protein BHU72_06070 [Desulfuribacillus stibiiarsenatis]
MEHGRYGLTLTRTVNEVFDPWELSNFINNFGNEYYKLDLLRTISKELQHGISPRNLLILNNPIKRKYFNFEYVDLTKDNQFFAFQSIGYPITLYPNKTILKISILIRLYKRLNAILTRNISTSILFRASKLIGDSFTDALDELTSAAIRNLPKTATGTLKNNISNQKKELESEFNEYLKYEHDIDDYITILDKNKNDNVTSLEKFPLYFNSFFEAFNKIQKPLIGVYLEEENKVKILCSDHLKKRKETLPELDFKSFGHNSPSFFDVLPNVAQVGKTIYDATQEQKVRNEQIKTEQLTQEYIVEKIETEKVKRKFLEEHIKNLQQKNSTQSNKIGTIDQEIINIPATQIKIQAFDAYNQQAKSLNDLLRKNKLIVSKYENRVDQKA